MRSLYKIIASFVIITAGLMAGDGHAADVEPPKIDRLRAYLLWEETGELSKELANLDYIDSSIRDEATGEVKDSSQMLIDVVVKAEPLSTYLSFPQPFLYISVTESDASKDNPPVIDVAYPISAISYKGQLVRTVLVEHRCTSFDVKAIVMVGEKTVSEIDKKFYVSCGD